MFELEGPVHAPAGGGQPRKLAILLHGYGADGNDLIGLAEPLAPLMPDVVFHAPNAPYPCDGNPFGYQWFGISRLDPHLMLAGVRGSAPFVEAFLDAKLAEYDLSEADTAFIGFSQGTMMSLHVGLRREKPLAGIVGFSGLLPGIETLPDEIRSKPPVLLIHGDADPMVPFEMMDRAETALRSLGVTVGSHVARGVGHSIDGQGLEQCARFLLRAFGVRAR
ncbi:MAG: dienelactone hydrolase family protein [Alphaproteobacteria bacterium]|nr:dienelactone hydrolase family protein [Alphaproteobacteria bacterium]MCW5738589.1 dienelactone hydrolase family protein [Alphaproteobacteria bacterium]